MEGLSDIESQVEERRRRTRPPKENAWVTLATNDTYALGALVLAHSLNKAETKYKKCIMVTSGLTSSMRSVLEDVFDNVVVVDVLRSNDAVHLAMLERPELGITFTKIHCWTQIEYAKCVFLDADTLVLQNCDELFDREEFSAAPDVGWPDCFNSGVFVFRPDLDTFLSLVNFALGTQSFDGGDQGLLNLFFKNWSLEGPDKRLPFIYNVCSTACYSYLPAFKMYGASAKIIHFIGKRKPWLFELNTVTGKVNPEDFVHLSEYLQIWWNHFIEAVLPRLDTRMATTTINRSCSTLGPPTPPTPTTTPNIRQTFFDPWDAYITKNMHAPALLTNSVDSHEIADMVHQIPAGREKIQIEHLQPFKECNNLSKLEQKVDLNDSHASNLVLIANSTPISYPYKNCNLNGNSHIRDTNNDLSSISQSSKVNVSVDTTINPTTDATSGNLRVESPDVPAFHPVQIPTSHSHSTVDAPCSGQPLDCKVNAEDDSICVANEETNASGLPARFSELTIGEERDVLSRYLEDHWRREAWESSTADYLGRDSFDKVWEKIRETIDDLEAVTKKYDQAPPSPEAGEVHAGKSDSSEDEPKQDEARALDPKGVVQEAASAAEPSQSLPSAPTTLETLVDVDSSAASNLGSLAKTVSQAVSPLLSSLEISPNPDGCTLGAPMSVQVLPVELPTAFAENLSSAKVAPIQALETSDLILTEPATKPPSEPILTEPAPKVLSGPILPGSATTVPPSDPILSVIATKVPPAVQPVQSVPRTPTVTEATPPTSPPIGVTGGFPAPTPTPTAASKEKAQSDVAGGGVGAGDGAAPVPPKRRGGPSKGGKPAVQRGKK